MVCYNCWDSSSFGNNVKLAFYGQAVREFPWPVSGAPARTPVAWPSHALPSLTPSPRHTSHLVTRGPEGLVSVYTTWRPPWALSDGGGGELRAGLVCLSRGRRHRLQTPAAGPGWATSWKPESYVHIAAAGAAYLAQPYTVLKSTGERNI